MSCGEVWTGSFYHVYGAGKYAALAVIRQK